ncbi:MULTISPECIES: DUF4404 family protein [unclassified Duganella]|jgi:hypothetical protein|uniref:DUF4404 family protein n=1 Tax=unclassified Duganella TaxID=2636909 RepID=UPI00087F95FF|nr:MULTISPECIES: DUF4404 family protein [unclassified Duganella]SDH25220.1 protein of unknown function [Duganella sp. OV458]SDK42997.1 protein of unknown function [Duganella sp. OV510]
MDSNLKTSLKNLHANLADAGPVDEELQDLLRQLNSDITTLLERGVNTEPGESTTYGLAERSQELSAKFAAEHPKLESGLRELGTILSNMGI